MLRFSVATILLDDPDIYALRCAMNLDDQDELQAIVKTSVCSEWFQKR